jgi:basic membrane protein A
MLDQIGTEPNVSYVVFDDHENSFLAGAAAALKSRTGTIGFVGGVDMDIIWRFHAGFEAGARVIDPDIEILSTYLTAPPDYEGFGDPAAGRRAAEAMYRRGADIVFHAAGDSGVGVFEAAKDMSVAKRRHLWAIGVDSDQYETVGLLPGAVDAEGWRPHILTSAVKRWDRAIYTVLADYTSGSLRPGVQTLDLESGGVEISYSGGFLEDVRDRIEELKSQIIAGQLAVPCVPVDKELEAAALGVEPACRR